MNADLTFDGRVPADMTDYLKSLSSMTEWQTRRIGAQEMQQAVLKWAVAHKNALHALDLAESLITVMEARIVAIDIDEPKLKVPTSAQIDAAMMEVLKP